MFQTKVAQKIKTHILCSVTVFYENRAVYEIMWENIVERGNSQMAIWRMRIARWITKAPDTHSEYVTLTAFPLQQRLQERASVLRYTYIACLDLVQGESRISLRNKQDKSFHQKRHAITNTS
jgi:hypothetical protein